MKKIYFTLTGTRYYYGTAFLKNGMEVKLLKEPDNKYDKEAIRVEIKGLGKIGYVANSTYTVLGDSMSAGRLYDKIGNKAKATVKIITPKGVICKIKAKSTAGEGMSEAPAAAFGESIKPYVGLQKDSAF